MHTDQIIDVPVEGHGSTPYAGDLAPFELPPRPDVPDEVEPEEARPRWARLALLVLLFTTAGSYLYNLAASGYGNTFYAAAVEAGSKSWKAMFFGSLDPSNFITVDKPPAALWVMDLSARIFGFSTWSVMVPGVLEGVAAVALLYGAVRRVSNHTTGLIAGGVLAATPVAALMFRFDNPDALLVLLLVAAAYCMTRAIERAGTRWLLAVGALLGFAFLTKMMQAFTVVPAFGLAYLLAGPTSLRRRVGQLAAALGALVVAGGWWVAIVALTPAADRPFIDGSPDNSIWNLIFDYNGFGRLSGSGTGNGSNFSGAAGIFRLFNDLMGGQAAWLLPAALLAIGVVLFARRHTPRTDRVRAAGIIWGGWLLVTGAIFSYGMGVIHTYYTVALAPAIAALVALGGHQLWRRRDQAWARIVAAASVALTAGWAFALLDRTPSWNPALRWIVVASGIGAAVALVAWPLLHRPRRWFGVSVATLVAVACLTGPVAYAADTVATAHTGSIPTAGPSASGGQGGGAFAGGGAPGGGRFGGLPSASKRESGQSGSGGRSLPTSGGGATGRAGSLPTGSAGAGTSGRPTSTSESRSVSVEGEGSAPGGSLTTAPNGAGAGGQTTSAALVKALESDASAYKWVAAVEGSQSAASVELATSGDAVMAIGGFNNQGGNLTLAAFESYVAHGDIHYYIGGSSGGGPGNLSSAIATWVAAHFTAKTIGGTTVYDLTSRTAATSS
jgi:4-amino-4-deoxy-L-arabinose transferase-like glycosyltransferase